MAPPALDVAYAGPGFPERPFCLLMSAKHDDGREETLAFRHIVSDPDHPEAPIYRFAFTADFGSCAYIGPCPLAPADLDAIVPPLRLGAVRESRGAVPQHYLVR